MKECVLNIKRECEEPITATRAMEAIKNGLGTKPS